MAKIPIKKTSSAVDETRSLPGRIEQSSKQTQPTIASLDDDIRNYTRRVKQTENASRAKQQHTFDLSKRMQGVEADVNKCAAAKSNLLATTVNADHVLGRLAKHIQDVTDKRESLIQQCVEAQDVANKEAATLKVLRDILSDKETERINLMLKITDKTQEWAKKRKAVDDGRKELELLARELEHLTGASSGHATKRQKAGADNGGKV